MDRLFGEPDVRALLGDDALVERMVDVEISLARAQAAVGVIPAEAAKEIASRAASFSPDAADLLEGVDRSGVPVAALVAQLRRHVGGPAAEYVHWGTTTQDIMDTALVLQLRGALELIERSLHALMRQLVGLAEQHRHTVMCGRSHAQWAVPITFGYKVARWVSPFPAHLDRLAELRQRLLVLQLGGAGGTLAAMGAEGTRVAARLAEQLGLSEALVPWHTRRDTLVELAGWLSMVGGSLGKIGQDVILMAQSEVGELIESGDPRRGGSSTMPQKSNPVRSEILVAAARRNATLLSSMHHASIQEHERGTHGWQMEWLTLPAMVECTAGALGTARKLFEDLVLCTDRVASNVAASRGLMLAEAVSMLLTPSLGREGAAEAVRDAVREAQETDAHLVDLLEQRMPELSGWDRIRREADYLGATEDLIDRVLKRALAALDDGAER